MREMKTHEIIFEKMKGILWPVAVRPCAWLKAGCACRPGSDPFPWTQTKASLHLRPIGIWGQRSPACAPTPVQCKMFSGIPGLHPLHANGTPPTKMSPDTKDTTLHGLTPTQTLPVSRVPEPAVTVELGHSARDKGSPGLSGSIFNSRTSRLSPSPAWGLLAAA